MKIGILVASDRHLAQVCGITQAAVGKAHAVALFATDTGTKLLADHRFAALSALPGVTISYCDHSAQRYGGRPTGLPAAIRPGSQFDNAVMTSESDKLVVL